MAIVDPEHKAMVRALMREYPRLDQLQCETLVWAYFSNHLVDNDNETKTHLPQQSSSCGRAGPDADQLSESRAELQPERSDASHPTSDDDAQSVAECE